MVVPPTVVVDAGCADRLVAQDHQRLAQQPLGLEVGEQYRHRLVQDRCLPLRPLEVVAVGGPPLIPAPISRHMKALSPWSRPSLSPVQGVRPNSVPRTTTVSPSSPLEWRSASVQDFCLLWGAHDPSPSQQARSRFVVLLPPVVAVEPRWSGRKSAKLREFLQNQVERSFRDGQSSMKASSGPCASDRALHEHSRSPPEHHSTTPGSTVPRDVPQPSSLRTSHPSFPVARQFRA